MGEAEQQTGIGADNERHRKTYEAGGQRSAAFVDPVFVGLLRC